MNAAKYAEMAASAVYAQDVDLQMHFHTGNFGCHMGIQFASAHRRGIVKRKCFIPSELPFVNAGGRSCWTTSRGVALRSYIACFFQPCMHVLSVAVSAVPACMRETQRNSTAFHSSHMLN